MIRDRNFCNQTIPSEIALEYRDCNFAQFAPIDIAGKKRGVRLFPGDDTPRTFIGCNLCNAEAPSGSIIIDCNTGIKEFDVVTRTDTITIDGASMIVEHHSDFIYGRFDPATEAYVDLPIPREKVKD